MKNQNSEVYSNLTKEIKSRIESSFSRDVMRAVAEDTAQRIRARTRLGKGVDRSGADPTPLKKRMGNPAYEKKRARSPFLDRSKTSPGRSNLTFTGQLLDAIYGASINARQFFISIKENRNDGVLNSDIVEGQKKQGRSFFYFSRAEIKGIYNKINSYLRKEFKL
jgi:hypothetical protein